MKRKIILAGITVLLVGALSACSQTDVVANIAKTSFKEVLDTIPNQITEDEMNGGWSLSAPDGTARFIWSSDYSKSPVHDVMLEFDSAPFVAAGLDTGKLPEGTVIEDQIMLGTKLSSEKPSYNGEATPELAFNQIVTLSRKSIGYHQLLDHYGVDLGGGNKFEWAKDMSKNDKDIVFVVDPEIFIQAGVNPDKVEGWTYASVKMKDEKGKTIEKMKFLKPFDLK